MTRGYFMIQQFPKDHIAFERGEAAVIYGVTVLCSVMYARKKREPTLLKVLLTKSATKLLELNTRNWGHFIFQLRKGVTSIVNQRKQGMWCI